MPEPLSDRLAMFIPLQKADAKQRMVYGYFDETPDRANEVCDYASARPAFEAWSAEMEKASDGKSLGNIRGQHSNIAAGKLVELTFDDDLRKVGFAARIVDDNEWRKVEEGVYTGFSPGGRYAKRWRDGAHVRYTPDVRELSIVDVPCNPSATFTMVKADGAETEVPFVTDKAYEPGNEATLARAGDLAKAAGDGKKPRDFVVQARAELIAENAAEALAKMAGGGAPTETKADPVAALEKSLTAAETAANAVVTAAPTGPFADMAKAAAALKLLKSDDPRLAKGLYTVGWLADLMDAFACLQSCLSFEAASEADGSNAPSEAADILKRIGALLVQVAQEEVAEAITDAGEDPADVIVVTDADVVVMELATSIIDLVKADADLMEKAGARNSAKDQKTIQRMHDDSVALGADCGGDANKDALAEVIADRDRLAKAMTDAAPKVDDLTSKFEKLLAAHTETADKLAKAEGQIADLLARPEMAKGVVVVVDKENDGGSADLKKAGAPPTLAEINAMPAGPAKQQALLQHAAGR